MATNQATAAKLVREYRCNACEGRLVEKYNADLGWHVACGRCGCTDESQFIHEYEIARQETAASEVLDGLPPELAALVIESTPEPLMVNGVFSLAMEPIDI